MTDAEFDQAFTGVVLDLRAGPGLPRRAASRRASLQALRRRAGRLAGGAGVRACWPGSPLVLPGLVVAGLHARSSSTTSWSAGRATGSPRCCSAWPSPRCCAPLLTWLQQRYLLRLETRLARGHVEPLPLARAAPADRVLQPALRAARSAARVAINDRVAQLLSRRPGDDCARTSSWSSSTLLLMLRYDVAADAGRRRGRALNVARCATCPASGSTATGGCCRTRQARSARRSAACRRSRR